MNPGQKSLDYLKDRCPGEEGNWVCLRRKDCTRYTPNGNMKVTNEMKQDCPGFHPFDDQAA